MSNAETVCGQCKYFELTTYPFIGKGICINEKTEWCYKRVWDDFDACDLFIADKGDE